MRKISPYVMGDCAHKAGIQNFTSIAKDHGYSLLPIAEDISGLLDQVYSEDPGIVAISYRLSPDRAVVFAEELVAGLKQNGLYDGRRIFFGGLGPATEQVKSRFPEIEVFAQSDYPEKDIMEVLTALGVPKDNAQKYTCHRMSQIGDDPRLIEHAERILEKDYFAHSGVEEPSDKAKKSLIVRMREDELKGTVTLRTHFGPTDPHSPVPTINGIERIAEEYIIGLMSLGSSQRTQLGRFFGHRKYWDPDSELGPDDGGVVIRDSLDMMKLYEATRRGNFPSIKPYCGTDNMRNFNEAALRFLKIDEAMQAVPLPGEWFSLLDRRGPLTPEAAVREHINLAKFLASKNVPIESNYAHHYALRYGHDTITVAAHGLAAAAANVCSVNDYIIQLMFNTPPISSWGDYARMSASLEIAKMIRKGPMHVETRTGLMYLKPGDIADRQLATSTLLQMMINPRVDNVLGRTSGPTLMHVVNTDEARGAADVDNVVHSAKLALTAIDYFRNNWQEMPDFENDTRVRSRRQELISEAKVILNAIGRLNGYRGNDIVSDGLVENLVKPHIIDRALEDGILAAPGIDYDPYPNASDIDTKVIDGCRYPIRNGEKITEMERLGLWEPNLELRVEQDSPLLVDMEW